MRTRPDAKDLLQIARETLTRVLLPDIPDDKRYDGLMVANAMANAIRELEMADDPLEAELERLLAIYPEVERTDEPLGEQLLRLNRQLTVDIRKENFSHDRAKREQLRTHLVQTAIERTRETNPKYLEKEGLA